MIKRIFRAIFMSAFFMMATCTSLLVLVTYQHFNEKEVDNIRIQTEFAVKAVEKLGFEYLDSLETLNSQDFRITWIDSDGDVLYDSVTDHSTMENHSDRKEVQQALLVGYGWDTRQSETLLLQQIYTAMRLEDGSVIRVASVERTLFAFVLSMIQPLVVALAISALLSFALAKYFSQQIIKPLHQLDLDNPYENVKVYEEITPLLSQIQRQYREIDHQLMELARRQEEFDVITRDMAEGLMLLGKNGEIISLNKSASTLFDTDQKNCVGKNYLTVNRGKDLQDILAKAFIGTRSEGLIPLSSKQYQVSASPMFEEEQVSGLAVLLVDVTEKSETEQIRREFTANVSHELKTPLHTISGCAELLSHNLVKEEDIPQFSQQIYNEAQRLIRLVEEIISLSRLDEGAELNLRDEVDLFVLAQDVVDKLREMAEKNQVSLSLCGESCKLLGSQTLLSGIVHNLCENAIKYNRPQGKVEVSVENIGTSIILQVKDTGIGVSEKEQNLIFQRFYRVDKSRSKEIGGTGLGLAIVKNAVCLHKGCLSIRSTLGEGTSIRVTFPVM